MKRILFILVFAIMMCGIFSFPTSYASNSSANNTEIICQSSMTAQRCAAITKAGTRCKRNAQAGSKYCWQHNK